jgi:hypothetical protein
MHANKFLHMNRSAADPSLGDVRYEMDFAVGGEPRTTTVPGNSNLRSFHAEITIRGFDVETFSGFDIGATANVPNQAIIDKGSTMDTLVVSPPVQTR